MKTRQYYQQAVALGSKTGLSLVSDASSSQLERLYQDLWRAIFSFERRFSRFLPGSELSMFNRNAGTKQIISVEFHDILVAARDLALETGELYNPFILPAVQAAGYVNSRVPGHEQDTVDDHSRKSVVSIDRLEIGDDWARIPYGTALDLGGCGKGYLADQLRTLLPNSISGYWLSLGGDIAVGGHNEQNDAWMVEIQSAQDSTKNIGSLTASYPCGIATSGTMVHQGKKAGKTWHHLIDPRTRKPAETDVVLATVCDKSALRADVFASCAVILGSRQGLALLQDHGVQAAVLQCDNAKTENRLMHFGDGIIIDTAYA